MAFIRDLFTAQPLLALFLAIALGYLVGKIRIGSFVLGGVAGTLIMGVLIGQLGVTIDPLVRTIFFALFIFAVGYQGGPQFFQALNRRSLNQLASSFVMCLVGLLTVLAGAWLFGLDRGLAAGLASGGLTQSAIIGTAGDAIGKLGLPADVTKTMQTNVAVGYAVTYIFGSLGPIILVTWFFPVIKKWNIRAEAVKLAAQLSGGRPELDPGEFNAVRPVVTRFFVLDQAQGSEGRTALEMDSALTDAAVEAVVRDAKTVTLTDTTVLVGGDLIALSGRADAMAHAGSLVGAETAAPEGFQLVEESREIVLTNKALTRRPISEIRDHANVDSSHGVFLTNAKRMGHDLPLLDKLELRRGDELHFVGRPADLTRVQSKIGYAISAAARTDYIFFGLGMTIGLLLGLITFSLWSIPISIGSGGGCLFAGLMFGWLRSVHPRFAAFPLGASNFVRDFGLAAFVGIVGLTAGPQALVAVQQHGVTLLVLGMGVTLIPPIFTFFFSFYVLRIRNPIEALACVAGGRSANPALSALVEKAGNSTPVIPFTVTYAVANVFLTLWGPIVVGLVTTNAIV
jgi:putative transport protein